MAFLPRRSPPGVFLRAPRAVVRCWMAKVCGGQEFLQLSLLDPERYFIVDGSKSIEDIHSAIITRVSEIGALKRNTQEDKGNLLLRPIRAAGKAVRTTAKKTSAGATKAVNKAKPKKKAKTKK